MKFWIGSLCAVLLAATVANAEESVNLDQKVKSLSGKDVNLADYKGKVLLIVNVASQCGATPQYQQLQQLHEKYKDQGLVVLGFPCNQFGAQEPGNATQIQEFCSSKYSVTFPLFEKVDVNGPNAAPLFKELTAESTPSGDVAWNFEKFIIGRDGHIAGRFKTRVKPDDKDVVSTIEHELAAK